MQNVVTVAVPSGIHFKRLIEQRIWGCLDCHEKFPDREKHSSRRDFKAYFTSKVDVVNIQVVKFREAIIKFSKRTTSKDGTHNRSLPQNWTQVTSATEETISDRIQNEINPLCETSVDQSATFSFSSGVFFFLQQNGDPSDGSAAVGLELQKSNLNVRPILQDGRYNPSTALDVCLLQCMSGEQSLSDSLPTSSPKGTYTFAGPSDVDVEAQRRAEDRNFVCPTSEKSNRRRADFVVHYRTQTGQKPYACEMCEKECPT
ncbi:hypothetical protein AVEN_199349-1 [Araneus ventricosus]|uniref:C2H2-type domain-containing protein n=1 Tax=Araneus ventricosus TaxID=182803 RepID=A0A4Y2VJ40_ARAVE|nr:hypothetical protein AVEN_199349-1 [Araneus ventricosus]